MLTLALVCGTVAAFPAVATAVSRSNEASQKMWEQVYVKTQNVEYTNDRGETVQVAISSNRDDSGMLMYSTFCGDRKYALVQRNADGSFEVKDSTLSEEDAVKIAEIASESDAWEKL